MRILVSEVHEIYGRDIAALLNPRPAFLLSAYSDATDRSSSRSIATIIWVSPITHQPPRLCFSIKSASKTFETLKKSNYCCLSSVRDGAQSDIVYCGTHSGFTEDKFKHINCCNISIQKDNQTLNFLAYKEFYSCLLLEVISTENFGTHTLVCANILKALSCARLDQKNRVTADKTLLCVQRDNFNTL